MVVGGGRLSVRLVLFSWVCRVYGCFIFAFVFRGEGGYLVGGL